LYRNGVGRNAVKVWAPDMTLGTGADRIDTESCCNDNIRVGVYIFAHIIIL